MTIREWTVDDSTIAVYDDISHVIFYRDTQHIVVSPVRPANESERAAAAEYWPDITEEAKARRVGMIQTLMGALTVLRTATADGQVTITEFQNASPTVIGALAAYRDYPDTDESVNKLALLTVTNIAFAYSSMLGQNRDFLQNLSLMYNELFLRVDDLEARILELESPPPGP